MKLRIAFVSNSSSSSYLAVGISSWDNPEKFGKLLAALRKKIRAKEGESFLDNSMVQGGYGTLEIEGSAFCIFGDPEEPFLIGIDAKGHLERDRRLSEIKDIFLREAKQIGVSITPKEVKLEAGEASDGG